MTKFGDDGHERRRSPSINPLEILSVQNLQYDT